MSWARYNIPKKRIEPKMEPPQITSYIEQVNTQPQLQTSNFKYSEDEIKFCLDRIDAICYINLAHRTDRNIHILNEIHKFCNDDSKIHRIDAIRKSNGALGCGLSHIKLLEFVQSNPEWKTVLVVEDDFTFKSSDPTEICHFLRKLLESNSDIEVGLLSYNELRHRDTDDPFVKRVLFAQTTSSYLVKKEYIPTLLTNFRESMSDMERNGKRHENCLDIHWTKLQAINNWYALYPAIGYQYDNYSDIENKHCTYGC